MNSLENLETVLRGFRPRRPSPKVRAALFDEAAVPSLLPPPSTAVVAWLHVGLAPLAAAALLLLSLATAWNPGFRPDTGPLAFAAQAGAWDPALVQIQRNALPRPSFRSTTGAMVASSFGSLLLRQTNALVR